LISRYGNTWGTFHGGKGGFLHTVRLNGADIESVEIFYAQCVNSITFTLSDGTVHGPFGRCMGVRKKMSYPPAESRGFVAFVSGSAGNLIDKLEFHFEGAFYTYVCTYIGDCQFLTTLDPRAELCPLGVLFDPSFF
jgi:hypothetical protein